MEEEDSKIWLTLLLCLEDDNDEADLFVILIGLKADMWLSEPCPLVKGEDSISERLCETAAAAADDNRNDELAAASIGINQWWGWWGLASDSEAWGEWMLWLEIDDDFDEDVAEAAAAAATAVASITGYNKSLGRRFDAPEPDEAAAAAAAAAATAAVAGERGQKTHP